MMKRRKQYDAKAVSNRLNWLRAAVLGANDGIVSIAGLVVGVAGATTNKATIFTAGLAGIVAASLSMAAGEYVSVSSQRDAEEALIEKEIYELKHHPEQELSELAETYEKKGLTKSTARKVAQELTDKDAIRAHLDAELGIHEDELTNPIHAALASGVSFVFGAILPLLAILIPPESYRVPVTFLAVVLALIITGQVSAALGQANKKRAVTRMVAWGLVAMTITYSVGSVFGVNA